MTGRVLWSPPPDVRETTEIGRYLDWLERERALSFGGYDALWRWSVDDLDAFWASIWDFFEVRAHAPYEAVLASREMPGAAWFPGARLNFAEHLLGVEGELDDVAVVAHSQTRDPVALTFARAARAGRARAGRPAAARRGPRRPRRRLHAEHPRDARRVRGDREHRRGLGELRAGVRARSVIDRLAQLEPTVLLAVGGYGYRDRAVDRRGEVAAIRAALPTLRHVVHVPYGPHDGRRRARLGRPARGERAARVRAGAVRPSAVRALLVGHDRAAEGDRARPRRDPARGLKTHALTGTSSRAAACSGSARPRG